MTWLEELCSANDKFKERIEPEVLPVERQACPYGIITCMDPRVNLEAVGLQPFRPNGQSKSQVRVIRTIGGMAEARSLVIGIHLAGFKEIAVIMHTDCGCSLAYSKIDKIIENMEASLSSGKLKEVKRIIGEPFRQSLRAWLFAFQNPREAVIKEVLNISKSPFVPQGLIVHGLVYDLATGGIEIIVNGYDQ